MRAAGGFIVKVLFGKKPDGAGLSELAVDIRIPAVYTIRAHADPVLAAFIAGFSIRMVHTMCQR